MWEDEILEEIHQVREEHAKAFNYDLQASCDELRRNQALSGRKIISTPLKQPRLSETKQRPKFGSAKGLVKVSDDFDEPLFNP